MKKSIWQFSKKKQFSFQYMIPILFSAAVIAIALAVLMWNTLAMNRHLQTNALQYADDISAQLASNISSRMSMREIYIRNLADTFSRMPKQVLTQELLERKAQYLEMDSIFLLNADGSTFPDNVRGLHPELEEHLLKHPEIHQEAHVFYSEHQEVFFSAPISWKDGSESSSLIGIRSNETLQKMLQDVDFKDQGLCCIVDRNGTVIVSATDETPFRKLNDIITQNSDLKDNAEIQRLMADLDAKRPGVAELSDIGGEAIVLAYDFLSINDWVLLTLLPMDLFTEGTPVYLLRYVVIIGLLAGVLLLLFLCVVLSYRRSYKTIQAVAFTDPLTGGKNRIAYQTEIERKLKKHAWQDFSIVYLNILDFKKYNEKFGSEAGDLLLCRIYEILDACLLEDEFICRTGGDHFYLCLSCDSDEKILQRTKSMFEQIGKTLSEKFYIDCPSIVGGAYLATQQEEFIRLINRAKVAGEHDEKGMCRIYDKDFEKKMEREQILEDSFQNAIINHEFIPYIQPKICTGQKSVSGGEVLVRWKHPEYGILSPGEFIPLFERKGKICELDFYMFEETCKLLKTWIEKGRAIPLSVNLSRAHLISNDLSFLERFKRIKDDYGIPDGLIDLELTESMMLERRELHMVISMINHIREMGFLCSIDDFGFGYSSLTMIKDLNVTTVKLDRQFFLNESDRSWLVVGQMISLAHKLGMSVVAEGIEDTAQVEKLLICGCDQIQGFVYARPMPISDFERYYDSGY